MEILIVVLLGILQGAIGFLPISTQGIQAVVGKTFQMGDTALLYCVFFHLGTAILFFFYLKGDILRLPWDLLRTLVGVFRNGKGYFEARKKQEPFEPQPVFHTNHECFSVMAVLAVLVAFPLCLVLRPFAEKTFRSPLFTGVGFLIMAVIFLVGGMLKIRSRLPIFTRVWYGLIAGCLLAAGCFPGISVLGILFVFATLIGFNRKTAQRFAGICYVLSTVVSVPVLFLTHAAGDLAASDIFLAIGGLAVTFIVGTLLSNRALHAAKMVKGRKMAVWSGVLGVAAILVWFFVK